MRLVLDTNVIVSATLVPSGVPGQMVDYVRQSDDVDLIASEELLAEYERTLSYPKLRRLHNFDEFQIADLVGRIRRQSEVVENIPNISVIEADPDDDVIVACAIAGSADYIVSGDRHLLALKEYQGIRVISPAALLRLLETNQEN